MAARAHMLPCLPGGHRSLLSALFACCLALGALAGFALPAGATVQAPRTAAAFTIPANEGVAIAQIATVRIVAHYTFTFTLGKLPGQTAIGNCTGLGVLLQSSVATVKPGSAYLLTASAVLSQNTPCPDAKDGLPPNATNITAAFNEADVYLSTAYSGLGQPPIKLQIKDATALLPNLTTSPVLIGAVATAPNGDAFPHDYPTVAFASQGTTGAVIDLKSSTGNALSSRDLNGTTPGDPSQYLTPASSSATIPANTSVGAPVVDATTGTLVGLVDRSGTLDTAIGKLSTDSLPGANTACPTTATPPSGGCLSTKWRAAMDAFYIGNHANDGTLLREIVQQYPDFGGAKDFLTAAQAAAASPTPVRSPATPGASNNGGGLFGSLSLSSPVKIGLIVLEVLLVLVFIMTLILSVRRLRGRSTQAQRIQEAPAAQGGQFSPPGRAGGHPPLISIGPSDMRAKLENGPPEQRLPAGEPDDLKAPPPPETAQPTRYPDASVMKQSDLRTQPSPATPPAWQQAPTVPGYTPSRASPAARQQVAPVQKGPAERAIFCPDCGKQQPPGAKVCPNCGFDIYQALTVLPGAGASPQQPITPEPGYPRGERDPRRLAPGAVLQGRYRIEQAVASGGMGAVYRATDRHFERACAVKEMLDHFSKDEDREQALQWFKREALLLLDLHHPAIPRVFDYFSQDDRQYLVMDLIEGRTLAEVLKQEGKPYGLPEARVRSWAAQLCNVLAYLHNLKPPVIFRDLKPANIMVTGEDRVKLIDFGIARSFQEGGQATVIMTVGYAPPEQMEGRPQPQSDLYALGATLHRLLTGHEARENKPSVFDFPSIRSLRPEITPQFEAVIFKALKKDIGERWASAREMEQALLQLPPLSPASVS
jgi:tRNA A-37 threonylcarbamoyl transferase component Bud32